MANWPGSKRVRGPHRTLRPTVEPLDGRVLLSDLPIAGGKLGPFLEPAAIRPRIRQTPTVTPATPQVNRYLSLLLGPETMEPIRAQAATRGAGMRAIIAQRVVSQPVINGLLGSADTYTLLNSPATRELLGYDVLFMPDPPVETPGPHLPPDPLAPDEPEEPVQLPVTSPVGTLAPVYEPTGPVLSQALLTGLQRRGPNTPAVVRGLRLARALGDRQVVPPGVTANYLRLFRVAVERGAFDLSSAQTEGIKDGVTHFLTEVDRLQAEGIFTPSVPLATEPNLLGGATLGSTVQVTTGAVRDLVGVTSPQQAGLPLFAAEQVTDPQSSQVFPGRIDAGFVVAANGDYGLILSARGPLLDAPAGFATDTVGGDVRLELSNATSLEQLNGLRVVEGTYVGSVVSGEITASRSPRLGGDLITLGGAYGFGTGMAFGSAVTYTQVIPLGNLNALIPQAPPS
ncbi:hypothetical protein [Tautonia sociabilis]|uniref:Uncharacterized protein n=1 Tax=Tautonia sociabilis TaxID=2080755 RepID=A0A432MJD2_9BACT|nr:hypothetical protein [Tautonia sociabilis]RUL87492.1 hypothetical protein TsocGM_11665 [Tautonia sociabilis]